MSQTYESKILDHLGLVAGMYDELEIGEEIDRRIVQDTEQRKVSVGEAVKAMVLNGLGFIEQRLYLATQFFETLPTARLLGSGIRPEHLNDDVLGRTLDSLYEYGVTELFRDLAAHSAERLSLRPRFAHLDATSFHVDGEYNSGEDEPEEGVIHVGQGYSRDRRPGLNQIVLDLIVEHQASLPILMEPLSGNASDQASFPELIDRHVSHLQNAHGFDYVVADSALYSADHVKELSGNSVKFITRVPETVGVAQQVIRETNPTGLKQLAEGYRAREHFSEYGDVEQRWLVVHSDEASGRAQKQVRKKVAREHQAEAKAFSELTWREFACREDAEKALEAFETDLKASTLSKRRVSRGIRYALDNHAPESQELEESGECWFVGGILTPSEAYEAQLLKRRSLFILATNELDEKQLPAEEILQGYKGQVRVERGFRFLKDPLFLASAFYLQSERRIMALLMVMTLCLLVYSALEWRIREGLRIQELAFPDQKGNPTQKPTARWVFQSFRGIHLLHLGQERLVLNMQEHHRSIVTVLGHRYETLYASYPT